MLVLVITKPLLTARVGMTTSFYTPLLILSSGSNGKVGIFLYYLAVWVEDKRLHLSFNNEVWQRLPISVPWIYRVHSILMIGITGSLDCVPLVHPLPFLDFSWPRWQCLLHVPFLFHCGISSGFKKVAWFPPLPSVF